MILTFCNNIRKTYGLEPLERMQGGTRYNGNNCPIANTIRYNSNLDVYVDNEIVSVNGQEYDLPPGPRRFVDDFDEGKYPQYDLDIL